jgi:penicillin-binding protein 1A
MKTDGAVSALVGGVDYRRSEFNRVTQAHRQPGSAFKPFVYLAALQAGISPWEWRDDRPVDVAGYQPANYKDAHYGRLRLADALARSVNTITVNLAQEVGIAKVAAAAHQAGISSPLENNASLALGTNEVTPLELASAYGFFANGGHVVTPFLVSRIENAATGAVLYQHEDASTPILMNDQVHKDMNAMLYQVVTAGTGTAARLAGREAAGKTGTTQDYRDAWFAGFTHDHVAVAWVGNDDNHPMRRVTGGSIPALLWRTVMTAAEKDLPPLPLDRTPGAPVEVSDPFGASQVSYVDDLNAAPPMLPMDSQGEYFATGSGVSAGRVARMDPPPAPPPADAPQPYAPQPYAAQTYAPQSNAAQAYAPQPNAAQAYAPPSPPPEAANDWREVRPSPYRGYRERIAQDEVRQLPYRAYRERIGQDDEAPVDRYPARPAYEYRDRTMGDYRDSYPGR